MANSAVRAAQLEFDVSKVEDDPECEPDDPQPRTDLLEWWCDICEVSDFFPMPSDPVDIGE